MLFSGNIITHLRKKQKVSEFLDQMIGQEVLYPYFNLIMFFNRLGTWTPQSGTASSRDPDGPNPVNFS